MTTILTISDFLMNPSAFIDKCIAYEEITKIKTGSGTAVLITEEQYNALLDSLTRTKPVPIEQQKEVYKAEALYLSQDEVESLVEHDMVCVKNNELVSPEEFFDEETEKRLAENILKPL